MTRWRLYVDESGDFRRDEGVAVGGLLLDSRVPGTLPAEIRESLMNAFPGLPWPLHAAHYNIPIIFALASVVAREGDPGTRTVFDAAADAATEILRRDAPAKLDEALDELRSGRRPDVDTLKHLDAHLSQGDSDAVTIYWKLREARRKLSASIARLVRQLARRDNAGLIVFVASESERGDAGEDWMAVSADASAEAGEGAPTHRYLGLLGTLFERTATVVSLEGAQHTIVPCVLDKRMYEKRRLKPRDIHAAIKGYAATAVRVRFEDPQIAFYDRRVGGAYVLADFVANRGNHQTRREGKNLSRLHQDLHNVLGVVVASRQGRRRLSHVAASGVARSYIAAVQRGDAAEARQLTKRLGGARRWAREQATQWAEAMS
jgi:hypothetical protein